MRMLVWVFAVRLRLIAIFICLGLGVAGKEMGGGGDGASGYEIL